MNGKTITNNYSKRTGDINTEGEKYGRKYRVV